MNKLILLMGATLLNFFVIFHLSFCSPLDDVPASPEEKQQLDTLVNAGVGELNEGKSLENTAKAITTWKPWNVVKSGLITQSQLQVKIEQELLSRTSK